MVLPVVCREAANRLLEAVERERPDAVVMLGIAAKRDKITPERLAVNVDDYRIPDNAGNQPCDEPIVPDAPAAYFSTLPIRRMVEAIAAAEVPAEISNTAGTYLCNHVFYALLHHTAERRVDCRAGFVHIPQMAEAAAEGAPSLPLEALVRGVRAALETLVPPGE